MSGNRDMGPDELRDRLVAFDRAVQIMHPGRSFRLVVAGGGALILIGCISRATTTDLDALQFPPDMLELMQEYDINGRVKTYEDDFEWGFEDRLLPIDVETKAVECFTTSIEDVVIAKLHSPRDRDADDIRDPELLRRIDWNLLDAIVHEKDRQAFFIRRHREFRSTYDQYREEYRPCED